MSSYTEQYETEKLKAWWKSYGNALILGVALGLAIVFGNKYWQRHQEQQRLAASELYLGMLVDREQNRAESLRAGGDKLMGEYAGTPYAGMAALLLAQASHAAGDAAAARRHLGWAIERGRDPATVHAARLRLVRLMSAAGEHAAALALVEVKDMAGFAAEYQELRGDLLVALGRRDEARKAYRAALEQSAPDGYRALLAAKLDDLGPEPAP